MKNRIPEMTSLSSILEDFKIRKYDNEFSIENNEFKLSITKHYKPQDLQILRTYRFESDTDPADASILYLIETNDGTIGYSLDAYGTYTHHHNDGYAEFINNIPMATMHK